MRRYFHKLGFDDIDKKFNCLIITKQFDIMALIQTTGLAMAPHEPSDTPETSSQL